MLPWTSGEQILKSAEGDRRPSWLNTELLMELKREINSKISGSKIRLWRKITKLGFVYTRKRHEKSKAS